MENLTLTYNVNLPEKVEHILNDDCWVFTHLGASLLPAMKEAIKFTSSVSVYVEKGSAEIEVNLLNVQVNAPCIVIIRTGEVIRLKSVTEDFDASFLVISDAVRDTLLLSLHDSSCAPMARLDTIAPIAVENLEAYQNLYTILTEVNSDHNNPNRLKALIHTLLAFYFQVGYRSYSPHPIETRLKNSPRNQLVERFLRLVQQNFKQERHTTFYAEQLNITHKHLSRTLKQATGYTIGEWIRNLLILEAKVMLNSSSLSIGEISKQLNFPSQSFFAKYFKKNTGLTPMQYRNSPEMD